MPELERELTAVPLLEDDLNMWKNRPHHLGSELSMIEANAIAAPMCTCPCLNGLEISCSIVHVNLSFMVNLSLIPTLKTKA